MIYVQNQSRSLKKKKEKQLLNNLILDIQLTWKRVKTKYKEKRKTTGYGIVSTNMKSLSNNYDKKKNGKHENVMNDCLRAAGRLKH